MITAGTFNPSASAIAFQNSISLGTQSGQIMKWNSNVSLKNSNRHDLDQKLFGVLYG